MEYDLLYKNAKYFSKYILPYYFVFRTKGGDIVIKVDESDFAHLVGKQHTTNEEIKRLNNGYFYQRVLDGNITFSDLLNRTSDDEKLSFKQEYINDKNDIFITIFELLISKINLKKYSINLKSFRKI